MASVLGTMIDAVAAHILDGQTNADPAFVLTDFDIVSTYRPETLFSDLTSDGELIVTGTTADAERVSRGKAKREDVMLKFGLRFPIAAAGEGTDEYTEVNTYLELMEQLKSWIEVVPNPTGIQTYTFLSHTPLKDDQDTPLSYLGMREANMFEAYWLSHFSLVYKNPYA